MKKRSKQTGLDTATLSPELEPGEEIAAFSEEERPTTEQLKGLRDYEHDDEQYLERMLNDLHEEVTDLLALYLYEIGKFRLLKPPEVKALAKLLAQQNDDTESRNRLVSHNLRLVVAVARRYRGRGLDYLDLIQEGNIGMMRATELYDHTLGYHFSTYAVWWIRQAVSRAIMDYADTIRVPVHIRELWNKIVKASAQLVMILGREPNGEEIATKAKLPLELVEKSLRQMRMNTVYLEDLMASDPDNDGLSFQNIMPDKTTMGPDHMVLAREALQETIWDLREILELLAKFPARNCNIFRIRYGLDGTLEPKTLQEVGDRYTMTRERVRQIANKIWQDLATSDFSKDEIWLEGKVCSALDLCNLLDYDILAVNTVLFRDLNLDCLE